MSGTRAGGRKAAATTKATHGEDFYSRIGKVGGTKTHLSGKLAEVNFAGNRELARIAGQKGGRNGKPYSVNPKQT